MLLFKLIWSMHVFQSSAYSRPHRWSHVIITKRGTKCVFRRLCAGGEYCGVHNNREGLWWEGGCCGGTHLIIWSATANTNIKFLLSPGIWRFVYPPTKFRPFTRIKTAVNLSGSRCRSSRTIEENQVSSGPYHTSGEASHRSSGDQQTDEENRHGTFEDRIFGKSGAL